MSDEMQKKNEIPEASVGENRQPKKPSRLAALGLTAAGFFGGGAVGSQVGALTGERIGNHINDKKHIVTELGEVGEYPLDQVYGRATPERVRTLDMREAVREASELAGTGAGAAAGTVVGAGAAFLAATGRRRKTPGVQAEDRQEPESGRAR